MSKELETKVKEYFRRGINSTVPYKSKISEMFKKIGKAGKRYPIFTGFLLYGLSVGIFSYWTRNFVNVESDVPLYFNPPGIEISEMIYNDYLVPYWRSILEPIGYEYHNVIDLITGEIIGQEKVPLLDYPLKKASDLCIPVSVLSWGLIGLGLQLVRNMYKRLKG